MVCGVSKKTDLKTTLLAAIPNLVDFWTVRVPCHTSRLPRSSFVPSQAAAGPASSGSWSSPWCCHVKANMGNKSADKNWEFLLQLGGLQEYIWWKIMKYQTNMQQKKASACEFLLINQIRYNPLVRTRSTAFLLTAPLFNPSANMSRVPIHQTCLIFLVDLCSRICLWVLMNYLSSGVLRLVCSVIQFCKRPCYHSGSFHRIM